MALLIDSYSDAQTEIKGEWWIAKPYGKKFFKTRIKDALLVLKGEATAVYFKEQGEPDEENKARPVKTECKALLNKPNR